MLKIYFGRVEDGTQNMGRWFKMAYRVDWFEDEDVKKFLWEVDGYEYIGSGLFRSRKANVIAPEKIAGGVAMAILLYKYQHLNKDFYPNLSKAGENCYRFIGECSMKKDIRVYSTMYFVDFGFDFPFICENDGKEYYGNSELNRLALYYLDKEERELYGE